MIHGSLQVAIIWAALSIPLWLALGVAIARGDGDRR